jgi:hypothetical protein
MPEDATLDWRLANPLGILSDEAAGAWHAGNTRDVLALSDGTLVAAADTSGVWLLRGDGTSRVSSGPVRETRTLAKGPDRPQHVYVGGRGLFVTFDLRTWREIQLPPAVVWVTEVACTRSRRRLFIATDAGLYFCNIPWDALNGTYTWLQVSGMRSVSVSVSSDQPSWTPWQVTSRGDDASALPGNGPMTGVNRFALNLDVFGVAPDGRVRSSWGDTQSLGLRSWFPLQEDRFAPGSRVAALSRNPASVDVVAVAPDGSVRAIRWPSAPGGGEWGPWFTVGRPGVDKLDVRCPVSLVARTPETVDVFGIGPDASPYRCVRRSETYTDWGSWARVGAPAWRLDARAGLVAVARAKSPHLNRHGGPPVPTPDHRHLDVFAITESGQVVTTWTDESTAQTWGGWYVVGNSGARLDPASGLAVLARRADHLDVFARGLDGGVYSCWWHEGGRWSDWFPVGRARIDSGTPITAIAPQPEEIHLFVTGQEGQPWTSWWSSLGRWSDWAPLTAPEPLSARGRIEAVAPHSDQIVLLAHSVSGAVLTSTRRPGRDRVVATAGKGVGDSTTPPLWYGTVSEGTTPSLTMSQATVTGVNTTDMGTTTLAMSAFAPDRGYAVAAGAEDKLLRVLRTTDGGRTWTACGETVTGTTGNEVPTLNALSGGQGSNWNNCIDVDPFTGTVAVVGWVERFITSDSGATWRRFLFGSPHGHADHHAMRFDLLDNTGRTVLVASDGGVMVTRDLGATADSSWNRRFPNLQFYTRNSKRASFGGGGSGQVEGLVAGGTQDNANLWSMVDPVPTPWRRLDGGDGGLCVFLRNGDLITSRPFNAADYQRFRWDSGARRFVNEGVVPVTKKKPGDEGRNGLYGPAAAVNQPVDRDAFGAKIYAVACVFPSADVYTGWSPSAFLPFRWEYEVTLPGLATDDAISALGSANSKIVYCGTGMGELFRVDTERHTASRMPISGPRTNRTVTQISVVNDNLAYALYPDRSADTGGVLKLSNGTWSPLSGLPDANYWGIDIDWTVTPNTVFVCDDDQVFISRDDGRTWTSSSTGLPPYPNLADLRFTLTPSRRKRLFLSTFGHSLWVSEVP